jgi:ribosomal protein S6--L-glutamate ligase
VRPRACAVVECGDVPGRNPLLAPLAAALDRRGVDLVTWDPTGALDLTSGGAPGAPGADVYLLKGDHPSVATAGACLERAGAACLNTAAVTAAVADKAAVLAAAARAGVPVPDTVLAGTAAHVEALLDAASGPLVVKPARGAHGHGVVVVDPGGPRPSLDAAHGPWLVQQHVAGDGEDRKVYGVGDRAAVRRMRWQPGRVDARRVPCDAPALAALGARAAAACGLVAWGADLVVGADGPVLVDLNAFPGYRTVEEAPGWLADAVVAHLAGEVAA